MVDAEKDLLFAQVGGQRRHVVTPPLEFDVMPLFDAIHAHVDLGLGWRHAGHLFAQEKVGITAEVFGGVDGIVIGDRHQIHAALLQSLVHSFRVVVAFPAEAMESGNVAHARVTRMDV